MFASALTFFCFFYTNKNSGFYFSDVQTLGSLLKVVLSVCLTQRQHYHQYNKLRDKCVRWLCDFLHLGLHGAPPERPSVRGGGPWPWISLCGLPRSPHSVANLSTLVAAILLHAHPSGTRNPGESLNLLVFC